MSISRGLTNSITTSLTTGIIAVQGGAFTPASIEGLQAWYDTSDTNTITSSGGSVSKLDDKSGNANHATQATGANQPATGTRTINSLNALDYDGSSDRLDLPLSLLSTIDDSNNTYFIVAQTDDTSSNKGIFGVDVVSSTIRQGIRISSSSSIDSIQNPSFTTSGFTTSVNTNPHVFGAIRDGSTINTLYNNFLGDNGSAADVTAESGTLGSWGTLSFFDGLIAEAVFYNRALTESERNQIYNYLSEKWNAKFLPTDISNLEAWYDASDTSTITDSSGSVSQWDDKSGNANHATQATGAKQPITNSSTINGLNAIKFGDGGTTHLLTADLAITTDWAFNIVLNNTGSALSLHYFLSSSSSGFGAFTEFSSQSDKWGFAADGSNILSDQNLTEGTPYILTVEKVGTVYTLFVNGVQTQSSDLGVNYTWSQTLIGARSGFETLYLVGDIGELTVYGKELSASEKNQVGNYSADKWNISWTDI